MNGPGFRLSHMAELLGLRLQGEDMTVTGVNTLEEAGPTRSQLSGQSQIRVPTGGYQGRGRHRAARARP